MKLIFENNATRRAIIVVALGFLALALAYTARAVLGLAMPIWEDQMNWSRSYVSNVAAIALLVMALVAPLSGFLLDRKGLRFTLLFGLLAVCLSSILISIAESRWLLFIGFGVIGGVGFGIVATHVVAAAVARVYPQKVGLASGIATSGSTAGQFVFVPLIAVLLASFSWRWGFVGIAIGTALLIPLVWYVPDDRVAAPSSRVNNKPDGWRSDVSKLLKSPVFHLLFWSYLI